MKDKKERKDNRADSFRSLNEILQFVDNFLVQAHQITPEEEEAYAAAPASYDDMTKEDWQKEYEARKDFEQQHKNEVKFNKLRKFLHIGIEAKRDDPDSELFRTSKELLDFVDRCESDPSSVRSYEGKKFRTALIRYKELLKGEATSSEEPPEAGQDIPTAKEKKEKTKLIRSINIQSFKGILGDVHQAENLQIGDYAQIHKKPKAETKNKEKRMLQRIYWLFKKIPHWIYALIIFLAALLAIFNYLGWLD